MTHTTEGPRRLESDDTPPVIAGGPRRPGAWPGVSSRLIGDADL